MKEILNYIPGFRSNKKWKITIGSIYYLFSLIFITEPSLFLKLISLPFIIFALSNVIRNKSKGVDFKKSIITLLIPLSIFIISTSIPNNSEPVTNIKKTKAIDKKATDEIEKKQEMTKKEEEKEDNVIAEKINLELDIKEQVEDGKVKFIINTNLPDETECMITLENDNIGYRAQDKTKILNGKAQTQLFSYGGNALVSGKYNVDFSTPISQLQPESVQKIIGENYKNIVSDYINKDGLGTNISFTKEITIVGDSSTDSKKYSYINPSDYSLGTAKRTVAEYINCWKNQDWKQMVKFCEKSWLNRQNDVEGVLAAKYDFKTLLGSEIIEETILSDVASKVKIKVYYKDLMNKINIKQIDVMVAKEDSEGNLSQNGHWGVNPISTLREEDSN